MFTMSPYAPGNYGHRTHTIDTITIHCMAGQMSVNGCISWFSNPDLHASANYGVCTNGVVKMMPDSYASGCSSNKANDERAITIEVASDPYEPCNVRPDVYAAMLDLITDICYRHNIYPLVWSDNRVDRVNHLNGCNMTVHCDYAAKTCPGSYLYNKMAEIAQTVNERVERLLADETADPPCESVSEWAKEAWAHAVKSGITDGQRPKDPATREEVITLLYRAGVI